MSMGLIKSKQPVDDIFARQEENNPKDPKRVVFLSVEGENTEVHYFKHLNSCTMPNNIILKIEVLERTEGSKSALKNIYELLLEYERIRDGDIADELNLTQAMGRHSPEAIEALLRKSPTDELTDAEKLICKDLQVAALDLQYRKYIKRMSRGDNDIVAMVVDCDFNNQAKRRSELEKYNQYCNDKGFGLHITNPCFEFWLLLHLSDVADDYKDSLDAIESNKRMSTSKKSQKFVAKQVSEKAGHKKTISREKFEAHYLPQISTAMARSNDFATTLPEVLDNIGTNLPDLLRKLGFM